jgi:hypothetical protein
MKKTLFSIVVVFITITMTSCFKSEGNNLSTSIASAESQFTISKSEFENVLRELNSSERTPNWIVSLIKWGKRHTGTPQRYNNFGVPECSGNYNCGPCPGFCMFPPSIEFVSDSLITDFNDSILGLRPVLFKLIQKADSTQLHKLIIEYPTQFDSEILRNESINFDYDEILPSGLTDFSGYNEIRIIAGTYPIIRDLNSGRTMTIVNIELE